MNNLKTIEPKNLENFNGYSIEPEFRHYGDYENDFSLYFECQADALNAITKLDNVFTLRDIVDEMYSWELKKNEDFVSFSIYEWKDGCGSPIGVSTKKQIIEVY